MDRMHLLLHTVNYMYILSLDVTGQIYWLINLVYSIYSPEKKEKPKLIMDGKSGLEANIRQVKAIKIEI